MGAEQSQPRDAVPEVVTQQPNAVLVDSPDDVQELSQGLLYGQSDSSPLRCDISKQFRPFPLVVNESSTASASRQAFANLLSALCTQQTMQDCPKEAVVIKMFFGELEPSLVYEAKVYQEVVTPIVQSRQCPCFVEYVGYMVCDDWYQSSRLLSNRQMRSLVEQHRKALRIAPNEKVPIARLGPLHLLVTKRARGFQAHKILSGELFTRVPRGAANLALQLLFTLSACMRNGLYHYDLHSNNYFIQGNGYAKPTVFAVDADTLFFFPAGSMKLLVFDWDVAYASSLGDNPRLAKGSVMCSGQPQEPSACNRPDAETAVYKTFCQLYEYPPMRILDATFRMIFRDTQVQNLQGYIKSDTTACYPVGDQPVQKTVGPNLEDVLRSSPDFDQFRLVDAKQLPFSFDLYVLDPSQSQQIRSNLRAWRKRAGV